MRIKSNIAVSDSGFVFDPSTGESFTFNPTGLEIFNYLKEGRSFNEIQEIITAKYDVDDHNFEKYFHDFASMLKQFSLTENE